MAIAQHWLDSFAEWAPVWQQYPYICTTRSVHVELAAAENLRNEEASSTKLFVLVSYTPQGARSGSSIKPG